MMLTTSETPVQERSIAGLAVSACFLSSSLVVSLPSSIRMRLTLIHLSSVIPGSCLIWWCCHGLNRRRKQRLAKLQKERVEEEKQKLQARIAATTARLADNASTPARPPSALVAPDRYSLATSSTLGSVSPMSSQASSPNFNNDLTLPLFHSDLTKKPMFT